MKRNLNKIYAFPCGLPGGLSSKNKVHIIAHSQGAQTVRYLQYLFKHNYFDGPEDDSWIASLTCMNPALNGAPAPYFTDIDPKSLKYGSEETGGFVHPTGH